MKGPFISKYYKATFQFFLLICKVEIIEFDGETIAFTKEISYTSVCITYVQAEKQGNVCFLNLQNKIWFLYR